MRSRNDEAARASAGRPRFIAGASVQQSPKQIAISCVTALRFLPRFARALFDAVQSHDRIMINAWSSRSLANEPRSRNPIVNWFKFTLTLVECLRLAHDLLEPALELVRKALRRLGSSTMLIDDAASRRFEGSGQRTCGVGDILVAQRLKVLRNVSRDEAAQQQQQSRLSIGQPL